jgi:hypothetical protein
LPKIDVAEQLTIDEGRINALGTELSQKLIEAYKNNPDGDISSIISE